MTQDKKDQVKVKNSAQQFKSRSKWAIARKRDEAAQTVSRMRRYRSKHADAPLAAEGTDPGTPGKIFNSAQALRKAIDRANTSLPKSPHKKAAVVKKLATQFGLNT